LFYAERYLLHIFFLFFIVFHVSLAHLISSITLSWSSLTNLNLNTSLRKIGPALTRYIWMRSAMDCCLSTVSARFSTALYTRPTATCQKSHARALVFSFTPDFSLNHAWMQRHCTHASTFEVLQLVFSVVKLIKMFGELDSRPFNLFSSSIVNRT